MPPLRECLDGIEELAAYVLDRAARQIGCPLPELSPAALEKITRYDWPGNVRQLENVLFQAVSLCEEKTIQPVHLRLPHSEASSELAGIPLEGSLSDMLGEVERNILSTLYQQYPSSRQLGKRLGVSHTTIANKLKRYGIGAQDSP
ncbi:hypothetical protein GCM10009664_75680 [Kitasatospora gansuensis]